MKANGIVQAVIILLLLAFAASCEVTREYSNRVFKSQRSEKENKSSVKFMESDSVSASINKEMVAKEKYEVRDSVKTSEVVKEPSVETKPLSTGGIRTKKIRQN
jgi:spore germination protein GerM